MRLFFKSQDLCFVVSLATILSFASFVHAQDAAPVSTQAATDVDTESVKRLEDTMLLTKLADEADQLLAAKSIEPARSRYQQVVNQTQQNGPTAALYTRANQGLGKISAYQAREAEDKKDYVQARQLWEQALSYDPNNVVYQNAYTAVKEKSKSVTEQYPNNTAATQELQDKVNQVQKLIFEGDSYVQTGQYDRAVARYKAVLLIDPYNDQARARIDKTEQTIQQVATLRMKQRKAGAMNQVEKEWAIQPQATVQQTNNIAVTDASSTNVANLYDKLQNIIIPECNFTDADLADVLNYLQDQSKAIDPKKEGVNIVFKGEPTSSGDAAAGGAAAAPAQMMRSLTLNLKNLSLLKILDFIQSLSSYKYKVEERAIYVFPNTETSEVMLVRTFSVPPNFFPATVQTNETQTNALGAKTVSIATADVKKELSDKGVKFAAGASAAYLPKTAKLVVRNTLDQLNLIDQLLSREANVSTQVEISTKFLEFSEDKLKDLSFNYRTQANPDNPVNFTTLPNNTGLQPNQNGQPQTITAANGQTPLNFSNYFPQPAAQTGDFGASTALRNSNNLLGDPLNSLLGLGTNRTPNMISLTGIVDGVGVQALITALESNLGADLMSEPKITLFNGQKSKIRAVRELRYPTQWDAPKIPTTTGGGGNNGASTAVTIIPSNPTNFQSRDVGVTLEVKANATPDRRIDLTIKPEVTEFQGFVNYGGNATTLDGEGNMVTVVQGVALTPVFSLRSVDTQMQVIDGQTVVMGGFIRSDNQDIEDKVPVLGDMPLVGRLFRSKSSQVVKRNLVIFLTARMIRPDGRYEYMTESEKELSEVTNIPVTQARQ